MAVKLKRAAGAVKLKRAAGAVKLKRAAGATLIISLLFLLILTLVGTAAMNVTVMEEKMAANSQFKTISFQVAESAIQRFWTADSVQGSLAEEDYMLSEDLGDAFDPLDPVENSPINTHATATITYCGERAAGGFGMNADQAEGAPVVELHVFTVRGRGVIEAVSAMAVNERSGGLLGPSRNIEDCSPTF
jgi:hypothetical protein